LPIPALQGLDSTGNVIYLNSFSKTLAPSLRIGYMVLPIGLIQQYRDHFPFYACSVPNFEQSILTKFIAEGYFERHLNRMRIVYKNRQDLLLSTFAKSGLGPFVEALNHDAGLHFLLRVHNGMSEAQLIATAKTFGVRVYGLSEYGQIPKEEEAIPTLVIGYSGIRSENIFPAVSLLEAAWSH
jgi:GntR family transcriptional regulator/MocR family aminotransferase